MKSGLSPEIDSIDFEFIRKIIFLFEDSFDGFGFNFIQDNSPPAISLIAPEYFVYFIQDNFTCNIIIASRISYNNSEDTKKLWLSKKYCGKKYFQKNLIKNFKFNELFDENWLSRFPLIVQLFN